MSNFWDDIPAKPRFLPGIEQHAAQVRLAAGWRPDDRANVHSTLKRLEVELVPRDPTFMGRAIALASASLSKKTIYVSSELLERIEADDLEALDTVWHELGHLYQHRDSEMMKPRIFGGNKKLIRNLPQNESAEWQATTWGRAFALVRDYSRWDLPDDIIGRCVGLPSAAVAERRAQVAARNTDVVNKLAQKVRNELGSFGLQRQALQLPRTEDSGQSNKTRLWEQLPHIAGEDPRRFRSCDGYRIEMGHFDLKCPPSDHGWFIRGGRIFSYMREYGREG
jgi:hypothetical protein